ncbi:MAG: response regulator [Methanomicrobium sp.]|nr:response regulator [Methanomicrobium sp.]
MTKKPVILIVEDDDLIGRFIKTVVTEIMSFESIGPVATCKDALRETFENNPDLIIMDIRLIGEGDGIDACERIRAKGINTPVIFSSASTEESTMNRAGLIENSVFLRKPYEMKDLMKEISDILVLE